MFQLQWIRNWWLWLFYHIIKYNELKLVNVNCHNPRPWIKSWRLIYNKFPLLAMLTNVRILSRTQTPLLPCWPNYKGLDITIGCTYPEGSPARFHDTCYHRVSQYCPYSRYSLDCYYDLHNNGCVQPKIYFYTCSELITL